MSEKSPREEKKLYLEAVPTQGDECENQPLRGSVLTIKTLR